MTWTTARNMSSGGRISGGECFFSASAVWERAGVVVVRRAERGVQAEVVVVVVVVV